MSPVEDSPFMLIEQLKSIVGPNGWKTDANDLEPHLTEWRNAVRGRTPIMVSPKTTEEVAAIVKSCAAAAVAIVPQGGNTGMCAGAVPDNSGEQVLLNLARLNQIRSVDADNFSMVVDAGCILEKIQDAAENAGRYFPLSLAAEGSCQIGGNLATNAGGLNVIRYGTARNLALGLEVVLADGTIWNGLRTLRKDTAGYDLKQLFIGSEGTLGIITAAALRLFPKPGETRTVLLAMEQAEHATDLLSIMKIALPDRVQTFELVSGKCFALVEKHIADSKLPFAEAYPWYVMIEAEVGNASGVLEELLTDCFERRLIVDAIIAKNDAEAGKLWRLRHSIADAEKLAGPALKHDISVPIASMARFLDLAEPRVNAAVPGAKIIAFGHVGDGNLHYNVVLPDGLTADQRDEFAALGTATVYDLVAELGGSFSAEHGVGYLKKSYLTKYRSEVEVNLMRSLKATLDPHNLLNPGKVL
jgi:FAD/FMN-containing dehydrogenase